MLLLAVAFTFTATLDAAPPSLLNMFARRTVEADPSKDYSLSEENGPWHILAACFGGEQGLTQAKQLVLELRQDYNLPAFVHRESYDYTGAIRGSGHTTTRMVHLNGRKYDSFAVLVGEFSSVDQPDIKNTLEKIKYAHPKTLDFSKTGQTSQRFAVFREMGRKLRGQKTERKRGPMGSAFVSRNPLLPDEFFNAPKVDAFVRSMNENVEHSLLKSKGKFTVVVRTFNGRASVEGPQGAKDLVPSADQLNHGADAAHKMVLALRKKGVAAYEFHDRYRSLVTVGEFESLGKQMPGGDFRYAAEILSTMQRYSANGGLQQAAHGTKMAAKHINGIPFDVNPHPIAVPRIEKRSLYAGLPFGG